MRNKTLKRYTRKEDLELNHISRTDSYKFSHFLLYEDGMEYMESYLEARGGEFDVCTLFGLQYFIHRYLAKTFTQADIDHEEAFAVAHGVPFNRAGWKHIIDNYGGRLPITIRALPEGTIIPIKNVIMSVRSPNDPGCAWIVNWMETLLSKVWYPSEVAIGSRELRKVWMHFLELSSDAPALEVGFKHHDFGYRGVSTEEQAAVGGMAHLTSFFGSDTVAGIKFANHYYDIDMSGFSIPATEHSTMTIPGKHRERETLIRWIQKTLVERHCPPGVPKLSACVGDTWDIFNFVRTVCEPEIFNMIKGSGGTLVIRPDSGDPTETLKKIFLLLEECLPPGEVTVNTKGYKVLPACLRLIWGDGINRRSMRPILQSVVDFGWSVSNLAMGSGGGLLMDWNRDTQKYAFKCCAAIVNGEAREVSKDPITDPGKKSKQGRLDLIKVDGTYKTIVLPDGMDEHPDTALVTVFDCGHITYHNTFADVRSRMAV